MPDFHQVFNLLFFTSFQLDTFFASFQPTQKIYFLPDLDQV